MLAGLCGGSGLHFDISVQECTAFATLQTASPSYYRWHNLTVPRNTAYEFPVVRCREEGAQPSNGAMVGRRDPRPSIGDTFQDHNAVEACRKPPLRKDTEWKANHHAFQWPVEVCA